jgi:hypothetical protein
LQNPVIFLTRYSILLEDAPGWLIRRQNSFEDYRGALFADERLEQRLAALTKVMLPSLAAQTVSLDPSRFRAVIFTSDELPAHHMAALVGAVSGFPWIRIETVNSKSRPDYEGATRTFLTSIGHRGAFATVRMDDDDALARNYLERLYPWIDESAVGKAITFPRGYAAKMDAATCTFSAFYWTRSPFTALGLAAIGSFDGETISPADRPTIYSYGHHARIGRHYPYIEDPSFPAFLRTVYPEQDTGGRKALHWRKRVPRRMVMRDIPLPEALAKGAAAPAFSAGWRERTARGIGRLLGG